MREIFLDTTNMPWRLVLVNMILALSISFKVVGLAPSLNFLDYFIGMTVFCFFCANFNTDQYTLDDFNTCRDEVHTFSDIFHIVECQEVLIPAYLTSLACLCASLAVINVFLIFLHWLGNAIITLFCWKDRKSDLQVLKMSARRHLEHELQEALENDGHFVELDEFKQGAIDENLNDPRTLKFSKELGEYTYDEETVTKLKDLVLHHSRNLGKNHHNNPRNQAEYDTNDNPFQPSQPPRNERNSLYTDDGHSVQF